MHPRIKKTGGSGPSMNATGGSGKIMVDLEKCNKLKVCLENRKKINSFLTYSARMWPQEYKRLKKELNQAHFEKERSDGQCGSSFLLNTPHSSAYLSSALLPTTLRERCDRDSLKKQLSYREILFNLCLHLFSLSVNL